MPVKVHDSKTHGTITIDSPPPGGREPNAPAPVPATIVTSSPWTTIPIPASLGKGKK